MVLYFAAMLTIGFVYSKRSNSSTKQYFAGGRGVGPWLPALSAEASAMSGWLLMGLPGVAYFTGAADPLWPAIGLALGTYLNWNLVARRLRRYSVVAGDAITIPDFFSKRFHDDRNIVSTIAALIILVFFCVYVGSCFVTVGKLFSTLFGWDYHLTMVIGAAIVFAYTIIGGYLSVVVTDFIQGLLMFFALAVVFIGSVASAGGIDNTVAFLEGRPANNVLLYGEGGTGKSSSITALLTEYAPRGLRMIELYKHQMADFEAVRDAVKWRNYKFVIFMDDLSFAQFEVEYKFLKAFIEGGLEKRPDNELIYATSHRRHLMKETWSDRDDKSDDMHESETMQEKMSLVDRFGLMIRYFSPEQEQYLDSARRLAAR